MAPQLWPGFSGVTRKPAPRWASYLALALFVGFGVAFLIGGIHRYDAVKPIAGGRTTAGTVTQVNTRQNCGRHGCTTYYTPIIQFTANGRDFTFAGPDSNRSMNTGDQVQVSYDPGNPAVAHDLSAGEGQAWTQIAVGAVAILFGLGSFIAGFSRLHTRFGLTSARQGGLWVGHSGLHSVRGISVGVVALVAILILQNVVH